MVCHLPPGNSGNSKTLCLSSNSVETHLNKGDFLGSCNGFNSAIAGYQPFGVGVYPNPFTDFTEIHYDLLEEGSLTLAIYDFNGNLLETPVDGLTAVGEYQYIFYGASYSGNMFYLIVHYQGMRWYQILIL